MKVSQILLEQIKDTRNKIVDSLANSSNRPNISSLRVLERFCAKRMLETDSKYEKFICFCLSNVINYTFYNLGGDAPYTRELQQHRVLLVAKIAERLEQLLAAVAAEDRLQLLAQLSELVNDPVERVVVLNKGKCSQ